MKNKIKLLYNPFEKIAGWKAFAIGFPIILISVFIAYDAGSLFWRSTNLTFLDGKSLFDAYLWHGLSLLTMCVCFYIMGLILAKSIRLQDIVGFVLLARIPYLFMALISYLFTEEDLMFLLSSLGDMNIESLLPLISRISIMALVSIIVLVWYIALLYNGYRVSTGLKGWKCIWSFIVALVFADILFLLIAYLIK